MRIFLGRIDTSSDTTSTGSATSTGTSTRTGSNDIYWGERYKYIPVKESKRVSAKFTICDKYQYHGTSTRTSTTGSTSYQVVYSSNATSPTQNLENPYKTRLLKVTVSAKQSIDR